MQQSPLPFAPDSAPAAVSLLFFSGGTALAATAGLLAAHVPAAHILTTFDSGGSSAALRAAFAMPAVGDLRARLTALANPDDPGATALCALFARRFSRSLTHRLLGEEFAALAAGRHPLMRALPSTVARAMQEYLGWFAQHALPGFPLAGASLGNLILAGVYLRNGRRLDRAVATLAAFFGIRGQICPVAEQPAHLAVALEDGRVVLGQHRFTGKERTPVSAPIRRIWLNASLRRFEPASVPLLPRAKALIGSARVLCFPPGSFYSSIVANLLPQGTGRAIAKAPGRKLFIPNLGADPELLGHSVQLQVERLLQPLQADAGLAGRDCLPFLTHLLVDERHSYPGGIPEKWLARQGVSLVRARLVSRQSAPLADPELLSRALASFSLSRFL